MKRSGTAQIQAAKEGDGNLIRIALVDDDTNFHIICSRYVREFFHANNRMHELRLYSSPEMVIYDLKEGRDSDVYFLDVEMPGMNGFELAEKIREHSPEACLIFLTSHTELVMEGYEVKAFAYLPKSLAGEKIRPALQRFLDEYKKKKKKAYLIETPSRFERVEYDEIIYLYREKKYAVLVLQDRQGHVRKPLRVVCEELDSENFMFIERGFVVNIEHILRLADRDLTMRNGDVLPVGRTYLKTVKRMLLHFWKDRI